jgi:hypothetical protein
MEKKETYFCLTLEGNVSKHGQALSRAFSTSGNSSCELRTVNEQDETATPIIFIWTVILGDFG